MDPGPGPRDQDLREQGSGQLASRPWVVDRSLAEPRRQRVGDLATDRVDEEVIERWLRERMEAKGHAVRATYFYTAMTFADTAQP